MAEDRSFDDLMARLRTGDDAAAALVFDRFAQRLLALARSRLDRLLRPKVDAEDVLQSVYRSFFRRQAQGSYELADWDSLWGLLTVITLRKCGHRAKHFRAACRNVRREVDLPVGDTIELQLMGRDPTPSEAIRLAETLEQVMLELTERERTILALGLQGEDVAAIGAQVGRTERTVQRVLQRVRKRLEQMHAEYAAEE
jgi:RNA polymerase sigma-70 factor (ECF subfamily)